MVEQSWSLQEFTRKYGAFLMISSKRVKWLTNWMKKINEYYEYLQSPYWGAKFASREYPMSCLTNYELVTIDHEFFISCLLSSLEYTPSILEKLA